MSSYQSVFMLISDLSSQCSTFPHRAIPDLSPGRWYLAITALNYRLMVCGGVSHAGTHSDCKWLDTNSPDPLWQDMAVSSVAGQEDF